MYKLVFLPVALNDINNITFYISNILKNKTAASKLATDFISTADRIVQFPYSCSVYNTIGKLEKEYRYAIVNKFLMFYVIDEDNKTIIITRVAYNKMNIKNIIN